ncbi:hypothetical protein ACFBZI_10700 [Moraxella sp. ZJ142]|uniref:hypothetical protein n=1 Tax=Moraxella marmotae TaxID=3344520 RepID=UPI0035D5297F
MLTSSTKYLTIPYKWLRNADMPTWLHQELINAGKRDFFTYDISTDTFYSSFDVHDNYEEVHLCRLPNEFVGLVLDYKSGFVLNAE